MQVENELMPEFEDIIQEIIHLSSGYLDFTYENDNYIYTDGNHLNKESSTVAP